MKSKGELEGRRRQEREARLRTGRRMSLGRRLLHSLCIHSSAITLPRIQCTHPARLCPPTGSLCRVWAAPHPAASYPGPCRKMSGHPRAQTVAAGERRIRTETSVKGGGGIKKSHSTNTRLFNPGSYSPGWGLRVDRVRPKSKIRVRESRGLYPAILSSAPRSSGVG